MAVLLLQLPECLELQMYAVTSGSSAFKKRPLVKVNVNSPLLSSVLSAPVRSMPNPLGLSAVSLAEVGLFIRKY